MENAATSDAAGEAARPDQPDAEPMPKRKVKFGLGIDIKAFVDEHMRRNERGMERLKNL
jgi:hypothetical protein